MKKSIKKRLRRLIPYNRNAASCRNQRIAQLLAFVMLFTSVPMIPAQAVTGTVTTKYQHRMIVHDGGSKTVSEVPLPQEVDVQYDNDLTFHRISVSDWEISNGVGPLSANHSRLLFGSSTDVNMPEPTVFWPYVDANNYCYDIEYICWGIDYMTPSENALCKIKSVDWPSADQLYHVSTDSQFEALIAASGAPADQKVYDNADYKGIFPDAIPLTFASSGALFAYDAGLVTLINDGTLKWKQKPESDGTYKTIQNGGIYKFYLDGPTLSGSNDNCIEVNVKVNVDVPGGNTPGGENPGGENPGGENPGGENPGGENPGGENPGGENPGGENPGGENPGGENPGGDNPGGNTPGSSSESRAASRAVDRIVEIDLSDFHTEYDAAPGMKLADLGLNERFMLKGKLESGREVELEAVLVHVPDRDAPAAYYGDTGFLLGAKTYTFRVDIYSEYTISYDAKVPNIQIHIATGSLLIDLSKLSQTDGGDFMFFFTDKQLGLYRIDGSSSPFIGRFDLQRYTHTIFTGALPEDKTVKIYTDKGKYAFVFDNVTIGANRNLSSNPQNKNFNDELQTPKEDTPTANLDGLAFANAGLVTAGEGADVTLLLRGGNILQTMDNSAQAAIQVHPTSKLNITNHNDQFPFATGLRDDADASLFASVNGEGLTAIGGQADIENGACGEITFHGGTIIAQNHAGNAIGTPYGALAGTSGNGKVICNNDATLITDTPDNAYSFGISTSGQLTLHGGKIYLSGQGFQTSFIPRTAGVIKNTELLYPEKPQSGEILTALGQYNRQGQKKAELIVTAKRRIYADFVSELIGLPYVSEKTPAQVIDVEVRMADTGTLLPQGNVTISGGRAVGAFDTARMENGVAKFSIVPNTGYYPTFTSFDINASYEPTQNDFYSYESSGSVTLKRASWLITGVEETEKFYYTMRNSRDTVQFPEYLHVDAAGIAPHGALDGSRKQMTIPVKEWRNLLYPGQPASQNQLLPNTVIAYYAVLDDDFAVSEAERNIIPIFRVYTPSGGSVTLTQEQLSGETPEEKALRELAEAMAEAYREQIRTGTSLYHYGDEEEIFIDIPFLDKGMEETFNQMLMEDDWERSTRALKIEYLEDYDEILASHEDTWSDGKFYYEMNFWERMGRAFDGGRRNPFEVVLDQITDAVGITDTHKPYDQYEESYDPDTRNTRTSSKSTMSGNNISVGFLDEPSNTLGILRIRHDSIPDVTLEPYTIDGQEVLNMFTANGYIYAMLTDYDQGTAKMRSGWLKVEDRYFYFDPEHGNASVAGKITDSQGKRFILSPDGTLRTGWFEYEGETYYQPPDINLVQGRNDVFYMENDGLISGYVTLPDPRTKEEKRYFFDDKNFNALAKGKRVLKYSEYDYRYYISNEDGSMREHGWYEYEGDRYYANGYARINLTGFFRETVDGETITYYFDPSNFGAMVRDDVVKTAAGTSYFNKDGHQTSSGELFSIDGKWYYISPTNRLYHSDFLDYTKQDGTIVRYYFDPDDNYAAATGFKIFTEGPYAGRAFYFDEEGRLKTGWFVVDGKKYYLDEANWWRGLQRGVIPVDNTTYYFKDDFSVHTEGPLYFTDRFGEMRFVLSNLSGEVLDGVHNYNGDWYYSNDTSLVILPNGLNNILNQYYYFENNKALRGLVQIDDTTYYFGDDGRMLRSTAVAGIGLFDRTGAIITEDGWHMLGYDWHLLMNSEPASGWKLVDNTLYYFKKGIGLPMPELQMQFR